jgi:crossover junction endodeoxyribonuclease RuvC
MRILGIDPGYGITGYSIIDYIGNKFKLIASGAIKTQAKTSFPIRLSEIFTDLNAIIDEYNPQAISVEELFFNNNAKTAINVAQARGVILVVRMPKRYPNLRIHSTPSKTSSSRLWKSRQNTSTKNGKNNTKSRSTTKTR